MKKFELEKKTVKLPDGRVLVFYSFKEKPPEGGKSTCPK